MDNRTARLHWHAVPQTLLRILLASLLLCCGLSIRADTFKTPDPGPGRLHIDGMWQFHTGDNLAWANPAFDDSGWQAMPADKGWAAHGHPGYSGYAWYRRRIVVDAATSPMGIFIVDGIGAYEVYWNGKKVGSSGRFPPHAAWPVGNEVWPTFPLGNGTGVLAVRFWAPPAVTSANSTDGGFYYPPSIGRLSILQELLSGSDAIWDQTFLFQVVATTLIGAAGLLALLFFLRERRQWLYLWLSIFLLAEATNGLSFATYQVLYFFPAQLLACSVLLCGGIALWLILLSIFGLNRSRRWRVCTAVVSAVFASAIVTDGVVMFFWQDAGPGMIRIDAVTTQIFTAMGFYIVFLVAFGLARRRSWSLVPLGVVALLFGLYQPLSSGASIMHSQMLRNIAYWHTPTETYWINLPTILDWLVVIVLTVTVILQQIREGRRQAHIATEFKSAQEVQQILVPEDTPPIPGLAVSSVYKPASEVGGDFFQVIPLGESGEESSTLIIVGDVSGKGLKAAMTVALIVGTVRTLAETTLDPAQILTGLNRRLIGRTKGFATCIVLRIDPGGDTTLSNAGHLSPFHNGKELPVLSSLPLGLTTSAEYENATLHLDENDTLLFITDGVLEARNHQGELYGFDRVAALMATHPDVHQVVEAACNFGQDDDITVLSVTRTPTPQPSSQLTSTHLQPSPA
ncbi:MAG: PP2C family protein-serine/threonine phosphatase [Acidobacteriaceae bacterium]